MSQYTFNKVFSRHCKDGTWALTYYAPNGRRVVERYADELTMRERRIKVIAKDYLGGPAPLTRLVEVGEGEV